jgi:hypothetical protein
MPLASPTMKFILALVPLGLVLLLTSDFLCQATKPNDGAPAYCITSVDCAMNGECMKPSPSDAQSSGRCQCFDGWKGHHCEELALLPVDPSRAGLRLPNQDSSTWGGSVVYRDGLYHMFASEIVYNCGLYAWTTNSQVIRAVSESPYGPYRKVQVILPPFAHDANVMEAPSGEIVLFVTALRGVQPQDCRKEDHRGTTTNTSGRRQRYSETNWTAPPKDTYMMWAPSPRGPWSEPVLVLNSTIWNSDYWAKNHRVAKCDSNLNGMILDDHSFLGLWRRCETEDLLTIPHTLTASDWRNASTYQPHVDPIFVLAGSGAEDPSNIWTTTTLDVPGKAYHAIFHDEQATRCMLGQCSANGRHAFSLDGKSWRYASVDAYQRNVSYQDGSSITVDTRARPHIILDPSTRQPIALSTGLKETDASGYVWTLVQPMRQTQASSDSLALSARPS